MITNNHIICKYDGIDITPHDLVACFDLDHTLIKPKDVRFSITDSDWVFYNSNVIDQLKSYHDKKYKIVIISNQKILKTEQGKNYWINKINKIHHKLQCPLMAIGCLLDDYLRKPREEIWDTFINGNKKRSFYCGDAGGLPKRIIHNITIKRDFSDTDLKFALNVGIKYMHRDEFIYNKQWDNIKPTYFNLNSIEFGIHKEIMFEKNNIIINIGYPGSGKSYFLKKYISGYVRISQDELKTKNKCLKVFKENLEKGESIIVDNTNPTIKDRKLYIDLAKVYKYTIRCINFKTSKELSYHNNVYRHLIDHNHNIVPMIAYKIYSSKYEKPTMDEGFYSIIDKEFLLDKESIELDKYMKYLS